MSGRETVQKLLRLIETAAEDAMAEYETHGETIPTLDSTSVHPLDIAEDALALRKAIRVLEGACEQLCSLLAPPAHTIVNRAQALDWACLKFAVEARIADILREKPEGVHLKDLSQSTGIESGKLSHVLRLLTSENIFKEVKPETFANNRLSCYLLFSNGISSLAYCQAGYAPKGAVELYNHFMDPVTGVSYSPNTSPYMRAVQNDGVAGTFFNWLIAHPKERSTFGQAMVGLGHVMNSLAILHHFPWSECSTVCDVGSGVGAFSLPLAKTYPHLKISLFDLEETVGQAREYWMREFPEAIKSSQVEFISGDFFQNIPASNQDVYYLRNVIHNWPDAQAQNILQTVRSAMGPNSRLLIHDYVLSHTQQTKLEEAEVEIAPPPLLPNFGAGAMRTYNQDLTMLIMYNSKERTLDESVTLASEVGLRLLKVWDLAEASVLEFRLPSSN